MHTFAPTKVYVFVYTQVYVFVCTQVYVFVCTQVYVFACTQVYILACAHKCMCPGGVGGGTCLPSRCNPTSVCKCSPQVEVEGVLKWRRRRACTVIRFQWGHRRIRTGKSRDMLGHLAARANSCQSCICVFVYLYLCICICVFV